MMKGVLFLSMALAFGFPEESLNGTVNYEVSLGRRRRTCNYQTEIDNYFTPRSVQCNSPNCQPPRYYVIADANGKQNVWTTNDYNSATDSSVAGSWAWWNDFVTRELYDAQLDRVLSQQISCDGAADMLRTWRTRAREVHECRYPYGDWSYLWGVSDPSASYTKTVQVMNGYERTEATEFTESISISIGVADEVFSLSEEFAYSYSISSSQTFRSEKSESLEISIQPGASVHVWQYVMTCVGFTDYGLFTEKLSYKTNLYRDTETFSNPKCLPEFCDSGNALILVGASGSRRVLSEADFKSNNKSGRGGALAFDVCGGGTFNDGSPLWADGPGSYVRSFIVSGPWQFVVSSSCAMTYHYENPPLTKAYSFDDGEVQWVGSGMAYFEFQEVALV